MKFTLFPFQQHELLLQSCGVYALFGPVLASIIHIYGMRPVYLTRLFC
jgi:hypothetical protein